MTYKVVRDSQGLVVAWGPDDNNFAPHIPAGCALSIESVAPSASIQQVKDGLIRLAQKLLDDCAVRRGYDDARSCISYMNSSNASWKADATAMNAYRDAVWGWMFAGQSAVSAMTTEAEFIIALHATCPAPW